MTDHTHVHRILELLADEKAENLTSDERAELDALLAEHPELSDSMAGEYDIGALVLALDEASGDDGAIPAELKAKIESVGTRMLGTPSAIPPKRLALSIAWLTAAAAIVIGVLVAVYALPRLQSSQNELSQAEAQLAKLEQQVAENRNTLETAQAAVDRLEGQLADEAAKSVQLATRLADATADLDAARLEIAKYEEPVDPEELRLNRERLLEVPDTIRVAWQPFDLPDSPALQQDVRGDVVWNNELEQGYLRFVGLAVNDPDVEQYQVWVIDERGMEQKVSGGVFNATADGELIVPIDPAIDVGRVAVFAITVEDPGGTWVPDLERRVVVAPTGEG